jgi:hypothetical protein
MSNKYKYVLVSVEVWEANSDHKILARRETEIAIPRNFKLSDVVDAVQRSSANMVELLKDYLTFNRN